MKIEVNDRNVKAMDRGNSGGKTRSSPCGDRNRFRRSRFYLTVNTIGQEEEGYVTGDVALNPEYVYVTGAESSHWDRSAPLV